MTSPYLFQPRGVGASIVVNALTKYIAGHGNVLGGSLTEMGQYDWQRFPNIAPEYRTGNPQMWGLTQIKKKGLRDFGAALAPEAAHHIAIGAETLALRLEQQCRNTRILAETLEQRPARREGVLSGARNRTRSTRWRSVCFAIRVRCSASSWMPKIDVFEFLNRLDVVIKSSNLGDNRTLAIPVAHTIYYEMGARTSREHGNRGFVDSNFSRHRRHRRSCSTTSTRRSATLRHEERSRWLA